jgi:ATP synthase protein I
MANMAWRMVIELVAGIAIGFGVGYGLDWLFGTLPIFLILFIGVGLAAGIRTMMRTAEEVQKNAYGASVRRRGKLSFWQQNPTAKQKQASYFIQWINFR